MNNSKILYRCRQCDEPIREGDTAYLLTGSVYCPGCVNRALTIARPAEFRPTFRYLRDGNRIADFPAGIPRKSPR